MDRQVFPVYAVRPQIAEAFHLYQEFFRVRNQDQELFFGIASCRQRNELFSGFINRVLVQPRRCHCCDTSPHKRDMLLLLLNYILPVTFPRQSCLASKQKAGGEREKILRGVGGGLFISAQDPHLGKG